MYFYVRIIYLFGFIIFRFLFSNLNSISLSCFLLFFYDSFFSPGRIIKRNEKKQKPFFSKNFHKWNSSEFISRFKKKHNFFFIFSIVVNDSSLKTQIKKETCYARNVFCK